MSEVLRRKVQKRPPRKRSRAKHPVLKELAIKTYLIHRATGCSLYEAFYQAHPDRRGKVGRVAATKWAQREIRCVLEEGLLNDKAVMMEAHGLTYDRIFGKVSELMDAKKIDEIVKTLLKQQRITGKDGKKHVKTYPVTIRNSELVEDNTTQTRATELASEFRGLRQKAEPPKAGGQNIAVIVFEGAPIRKKRQKRYAGGKNSER